MNRPRPDPISRPKSLSPRPNRFASGFIFSGLRATSDAEELHQQLPDPVFAEAIGVSKMIARNPEEKRFSIEQGPCIFSEASNRVSAFSSR